MIGMMETKSRCKRGDGNSEEMESDEGTETRSVIAVGELDGARAQWG